MKKMAVVLMVLFVVSTNLVACSSPSSVRKNTKNTMDTTKETGNIEIDVEKKENIEKDPFACQVYDKVFRMRESTLEEVLEELIKHDDIQAMQLVYTGFKSLSRERQINVSDDIMNELKEWDYYVEATKEKFGEEEEGDSFAIEIWYDTAHKYEDVEINFTVYREPVGDTTTSIRKTIGVTRMDYVGVYMKDIICEANKELPFYYLGLQAGSEYEGDFSYIEKIVKESMPEDSFDFKITDEPHGYYREHLFGGEDLKFKEVSYRWEREDYVTVKVVNGIIKWDFSMDEIEKT